MIYLIWAPPSEGKTYFATSEAIRLMTTKTQKGKKPRRVFSNYPIVYKKPLSVAQKIINLSRKIRKKELIQQEIFSTYIWKQEYMYAGLNNCTIFIDEAYRFFSSRRRDVKADEHTFFSTNGHDGNDIYLIAQHYIRLDTIIREDASYFVFIWKVSNPLSFSGEREGELTPLFFNYEMYISEDDYKFRHVKEDAVWKKGRLWFKKSIAEAYDTRYFKKTEKKVKLEKWSDVMQKEPENDIEKGVELLS